MATLSMPKCELHDDEHNAEKMVTQAQDGKLLRSVARVRDIEVGTGLGPFFIACFLAYMIR
jgi:hypothetical protein